MIIRSSEKRIFKQATKNKKKRDSAIAVNSREILLLMIAQTILHLTLGMFLAAEEFCLSNASRYMRDRKTLHFQYQTEIII